MEAQEPPDPIAEHLFPPELVQQAREEIDLTQAQQESLQRKVEEITAGAAELHRKLQREAETLAEIVKADRVDETKLLAQLDKVLDAERTVKRLHLTALAAIKNQLTPDQQARLRAFRSRSPAGMTAAKQAELRARLESKIKRIQAAMEQWQEKGRDPSPVAEIMQEFDPAMKQGKHQEAEAVLDRSLSELGIDGTRK